MIAMRYILVKARVLMGTPNNTLSLLVLTRTGWVPWSQVEGKTNCTDPDLCPVLSFTHRGEAEYVITNDPLAVVVPVDVDNPVYIKGESCEGGQQMKVYLVKHNHGYGDYYYNSFMVVASNETLARTTHPSGDSTRWGDQDWVPFTEYRALTVQEVGIANDDQVAGVLLAVHH